ncbi:MAG: hypothetical protein ACXW2T_02485, partial [Allosphingosinicella sp.]
MRSSISRSRLVTEQDPATTRADRALAVVIVLDIAERLAGRPGRSNIGTQQEIAGDALRLSVARIVSGEADVDPRQEDRVY